MKAEEYTLSTSAAAKAAADRAAARRGNLPSQQAHAAAQRDALFGSTYTQNYERQSGWGAVAAVPDLSDPGNASLEQLQAQTNRHQAAIQESQQRMLRMAADATQTGAATLEQLHHQGEQLKGIQKDQAKIDSNLATSDRILKGMESWGGALKQYFWGKPEEKVDGGGGAAAGPSNDGAARTAGSGAAGDCSGWGGSYGRAGARGALGSASNPFGADGTQMYQSREPRSADEEAMDQLASMVEGMHSMACNMKTELDKQSVELDRTIETADRQKDTLANVTGRTKKVGGGGWFS